MSIYSRCVNQCVILHAIISLAFCQELNKPKGESTMSFNFIMTSTAFVNEGIIPQKYTYEGEDVLLH